MGNDVARAHDGIGVGVVASLSEGFRARTVWTIEKWDEEATAWAKKRLKYDKPWLDEPWPLLTPSAEDFARLRIAPYETAEVVGNLLTTAGLNRLTSLAIAGGGQGMTNTATRIGVGNGTVSAGGGSVPAAVGDTDLAAAAGSANRWFQIMDATFPQQSNGVLTYKSTFASADGNFAWNEFGVDIGTPTVSSANTVNAVLFNHKTSIAQGTKASGQSWAATATITIS
jgi:hypothetical protein